MMLFASFGLNVRLPFSICSIATAEQPTSLAKDG
jgi:hypothetical protein